MFMGMQNCMVVRDKHLRE